MRALISVSDKSGLLDFAQGLVDLGWELVSTGGSKSVLEAAGLPVLGVEEVTGFPEMLDGRVKTLHPKVHGGILAKRDQADHMSVLADHDIVPIDLVLVNLYPFKETLLKPGVSQSEIIENIDIGGPTLLRSAAKNYKDVLVLVDPKDYTRVLEALRTEEGPSLALKESLAAKVFRHTAYYDSLIAHYFMDKTGETQPEVLPLAFSLKQGLRYGENPHQAANFYQDALPKAYSLASAVQLHGKELSYNNIKDADAGLRMIAEFDQPAVIALKHMNPCGVGLGQSVEEAYDRCYAADPVSIFGGVVVSNRPITEAVAGAMHSIFLEIVIAPSFSSEALAILERKKNIRLLTIDMTQTNVKQKDYVSVLGGILEQDSDLYEGETIREVMTQRQPEPEEWEKLEFAFKLVKHVKSNAIVLVNGEQSVGIGAGQMNRVGAAHIALEQAKAAGWDLSQVVMGSDAFFPMDDTVALAAEFGIRAIIQPGGSIKDADSVAMADKHGIAMVKTGVRHFKH